MIPADVLSKYGTDAISGIILMASAPHSKLHLDLANPAGVGLVSGLLSNDAAIFAKTVR